MDINSHMTGFSHKYDPADETIERTYPFIVFSKRPDSLPDHTEEQLDFFFTYLERCYSALEIRGEELIIHYYELKDEPLRKGIEAWMNKIGDHNQKIVYTDPPETEGYYIITDPSGMRVEAAYQMKEIFPCLIQDVTPQTGNWEICRYKLVFSVQQQSSPVIHLEANSIIKEMQKMIDFNSTTEIDYRKIKTYDPLLINTDPNYVSLPKGIHPLREEDIITLQSRGEDPENWRIQSDGYRMNFIAFPPEIGDSKPTE